MPTKSNRESIHRLTVAIGGALASFFLLQCINAYIQGNSPTFLQGIGTLVGVNFIVIAVYLHRNQFQESEYANAAQTINTKTEFVAFAAHQLRTPITTIRWETETLLKKKGLGKDVTLVLQEVKTRCERLAELVTALLNITKIDTGKMIGQPEKTDLTTLTKEIIQELRHNMSAKHLSLKAKYTAGDVLVMTPPKLLKIALTNILENAIIYSQKGQTLEVAILEGKDGVIIEVKDSGIGIPKEDMKNLFSKMFRASNAIDAVPEGNGLGLYMAKAIIDSMDGKIEINSEVGKGTTVQLILPPNLQAGS